MANPQALVAWLFQNIHALNPKIEHLTWISEFLPGYSEVIFQVEVNKHRWQGRGIGASQETALCKALAESIERAVMQENGIPNSNGIAAHIHDDLAAQNAINELRERDLFLCHFYCGIPFRRAPTDLLASAGIKSIVSRFNETGIAVSLHHLGETGFICVLDGRAAPQPFGFMIGAAIKTSLTESILSAFFEVASRAFRLIDNEIEPQPMSLDEFAKLQNPNFKDHGRLALNIEYAEQIAFLFQDHQHSISTKSTDYPITVRRLSTNDRLFMNCPIKFAYAYCSSMQSLFSGLPALDKLNLSRLSQFAGKEVTWESVTKLPHPFN